MIKWRKFCHLCHGMDSQTILISHYCITWNQIQLNLHVTPKIIFHLPYAGKAGEQLLKRCLKKFKCCLNSYVKFRVLYDAKKMLFYCNIKDKVPHDQGTTLFIKSSVLVAMDII